MATTIPDTEPDEDGPSEQDSSPWKARLVSRIAVSLAIVIVGWSYFTGRIHEWGVILIIAGAVVAVLWLQFGLWVWATHPDLLHHLLVRFGRYPVTLWWFTSLPGVILMAYLPESIEDHFYIISESDMDNMVEIDDILQNDESEIQK